MITVYTLIIVFTVGVGGGAVTLDYGSLETCQAAAVQMVQEHKEIFSAFCIERN